MRHAWACREQMVPVLAVQQLATPTSGIQRACRLSMSNCIVLPSTVVLGCRQEESNMDCELWLGVHHGSCPES